jgi:hypothetical protein
MPTFADEPPYHYVAYIDEAGDPGLTRVRPLDPQGASEWLVFGGVLIRSKSGLEPVTWIRNILTNIGLGAQRELHFRNLTEWRKPLVCRALGAQEGARFFALLSNKKNMKGHTNPRAAAKSPAISKNQYFYNYCARLLLERMTDYAYRHSMAACGKPRLTKIIFSNRDGHAWGHVSAYIEILKQQARSGDTYLDKRTINWKVVDWRLIDVEPHTLNAGLQLADVVASSFYQAVDILPPTRWNPENAQYLRPRVAKEGGLYLDYGVALQPTPPHRAKLLPRQREIFEFYGYSGRDF